jgi:hypothetical protein
VLVVQVRGGGIQADLQGEAVAVHPAQHVHAPAAQQHGVGEQDGRQCRRARRDQLIEVWEQERLTAGQDELPDPDLDGFLCQSADTIGT